MYLLSTSVSFSKEIISLNNWLLEFSLFLFIFLLSHIVCLSDLKLYIQTMSYILQGSGTLLGPCLAHLVGREAPKFSACICLKCSRLISSMPERGKFIQFPTTTNHADPVTPSQPFPQLQAPSMRGDLAPLPNLEGYRRKYPSALFREKYYTSYATSLPHLGHPNPVNINMSFTVGPELTTGEE